MAHSLTLAPALGDAVQNGANSLFSIDSVDKQICPSFNRDRQGTKQGQVHLSIESIDSSLLTSKKGNVPKCKNGDVAVFTPPTIEFFDRSNAPKFYHDPDADGRKRRLSPAEIARHSTGIDRTTGQRTLGIGIRNRHNGMVRFACDLWRLDYDLNALAIERLQNHWQLLNEHTPAKVQVRMGRQFSRTFIQFDTLPEQMTDWRGFLATVLSDADSFAGIGRCISMSRVSV